VKALLKLVNKCVVHVHPVFELLQNKFVPLNGLLTFFPLQLLMLLIRNDILEVTLSGNGNVVHALHKLLIEIAKRPTLFHN
jgi:hypothetical protein